MPDLPTTPKGKIARLPARLREEVCRRLHDMQPASVLLAWLNAEAETQRVMREQFAAEPVSEQNLSAWRQGGFQLWLREQRHIQRTLARADYARKLAEASGGNLAEGALAQLTGEVLEMVEEIAELREAGQEIDPKLLDAVNKSLVAARAKELETRQVDLKTRLADQKDRALDLDEARFELRYCEQFEDHAKNAEALRIATSDTPHQLKMEQLRLALFGRKPEAAAA